MVKYTVHTDNKPEQQRAIICLPHKRVYTKMNVHHFMTRHKAPDPIDHLYLTPASF